MQAELQNKQGQLETLKHLQEVRTEGGRAEGLLGDRVAPAEGTQPKDTLRK